MTARDRMIIAVVLMAAAVAGFWFVGSAPKRQEAADLQAQVDVANKKLADAQQMASQARRAKASYEKDYAQVAKLGKAVPKSDALPSLIYQLQSVAHDSRIDFRTLKVSGAGSVGAVAPTAAAPAAGSTSSSTATSATATQAAAAALPPGASVGSAGFPTMPFSFVFSGSFFDMERFIHDVQRFVHVRGQDVDVTGRLLSIDAFSLTAGPDGFPSVRANVTATAYVLAPGDDATPAASQGTATPAPTTSAPAATASEVAR